MTAERTKRVNARLEDVAKLTPEEQGFLNGYIARSLEEAAKPRKGKRRASALPQRPASEASPAPHRQRRTAYNSAVSSPNQ